jgi:hypothetical protein
MPGRAIDVVRTAAYVALPFVWIGLLANPLGAAECPPSGRPLIGELFYDAIGDDTGLEFVELYNPSALPAPLAGLRLEAGDGSGPGRWSLRWTGTQADTVPALGRFVIGGSRVSPPPQAITALDLQNGPDAVRLVWPDGGIEVLGYGAHPARRSRAFPTVPISVAMRSTFERRAHHRGARIGPIATSRSCRGSPSLQSSPLRAAGLDSRASS